MSSKLTSSRRYSPTSLHARVKMVKSRLRRREERNGGTHAWLNTMIAVGSVFLVSIVLLAVTPKPCRLFGSEGERKRRGGKGGGVLTRGMSFIE